MSANDGAIPSGANREVGLPHPPSRKPGVIYLICSRCDVEFLEKMELFKQQSLRRRSRRMMTAV
jgi:hypothetical protein